MKMSASSDGGLGFLSGWGFVEWALSAAYIAGGAVGAFVWNLSTRVVLQGERQKVIRAEFDTLKKEHDGLRDLTSKLATREDLMNVFQQLTSRIDRLLAHEK